MKIKSIQTTQGLPYTEGYAEVKNPKTGVDTSGLAMGSVELMPVTIAVAPGVTHDGDMGRLGKSE